MPTIIFIQVIGSKGLIEAQLPEDATNQHLLGVLAEVGVELGEDTFIFVDEAEKPLDREGNAPLLEINRGCRIYVSKCRKIEVTAHYLEKTINHAFAPGARVGKVKHWAVKEFELDHHDAVEHVLQLCSSTDRPATDTPLHALTENPACSVCFDLVPEKRVEG